MPEFVRRLGRADLLLLSAARLLARRRRERRHVQPAVGVVSARRLDGAAVVGVGPRHACLAEGRDRPARVALWGALAYMAAPYHLLVDHYIRGAFAEGAAYALLPLVMLGIRQIDRPAAVTHRSLLALAYGGLARCRTCRRRCWCRPRCCRPTRSSGRRDVARCCAWPQAASSGSAWLRSTLAGGNAAGLDLGRPAVDPLYRVDNWFLVAPGRWPEAVIMQIVAFITAAALICRRPLRGRAPAQRGVVLGGGLAAASPCWPAWCRGSGSCRIGQGAVSLAPAVAVEFALITALCVAPLVADRAWQGLSGRRRHRRLGRRIRAIGAVARASPWRGTSRARAQDVKQYEPRGFPIAPRLRFRAGPRAGEERRDLVHAGGIDLPGDARPLRRDAARHREPGRPGECAALLFSRLAARRAAMLASDPYRLVSFTAPAGRMTSVAAHLAGRKVGLGRLSVAALLSLALHAAGLVGGRGHRATSGSVACCSTDRLSPAAWLRSCCWRRRCSWGRCRATARRRTSPGPRSSPTSSGRARLVPLAANHRPNRSMTAMTMADAPTRVQTPPAAGASSSSHSAASMGNSRSVSIIQVGSM